MSSNEYKEMVISKEVAMNMYQTSATRELLKGPSVALTLIAL